MKITPRDYQEEAVEECLKFLKKKNPKPGVVVHSTGLGKSVAIGYLVSKIDEPVLILQPSVELLKQNYNKLVAFGGEASLYSASAGVKEIGHVTYATLESIKDKAHLFKEKGVRILLIDECDRKFSPEKGSMFQKFVGKLKPTHIIGYTATPFRLKRYNDLSGNSFSQLNMITRTRPKIFHDYLHIVQIEEAVRRKYWANINYTQYDFDESDLKLNTMGSEFTEQSIKAALEKQNINAAITYKAKELLAQDKSALVFMDSVANAEILAKYLGEKAACVSGKTKKSLRKEIVEKFTSGDIKIVVNHSALGIGFDYPELEYVILGRPTNSLSSLYQWVGRSCRNPEYPNQKEAYVIDFCGNISRFGKMETLKFQDIPGYGWGLTNDKYLLTGVPMDSKTTIQEIIDRNSCKVEYVMEWGKHKGKLLSDVPFSYRNWMLSNLGDMNIKSISKSNLKSQLLSLLEQKTVDVKFDPKHLIAVDFNNITHILYKKKKLNAEGLKGYCRSMQELLGTSNVKVFTDDKKENYWRKGVYPEYKENRRYQKKDESFLEGLIDCYNSGQLIKRDSFEADDLIAEEVRSGSYEKVTVVSGDGDFKTLAFYNCFRQVNPSTRKPIKTSKIDAVDHLVTQILKGDNAKDNIKKSHKQRQIRKKDLEPVLDKIWRNIVDHVKTTKITDVEELPLKDIFWKNLSENFEMCEESFNLNFKLLNLIQKQY